MAAFKDIGSCLPKSETLCEPLEVRPLFEDFDPQKEGGLVVLDDGVVAEVKSPTWVAKGRSTELQDRMLTLPIRCERGADGELGFTWLNGREWNPKIPTMGSEVEIEVRRDGSKYRITENGTELLYPNGDKEPLHDVGLEPEGFKQTVEFKTDVAYGWTHHEAKVVAELARVERWLEDHGLEAPYLSVLADLSKENDITGHSWVQLINKKMRSLLEFNCMSVQLHVQLASVEAGMHALTKYQGVQALFGLLTAASPIRDGSFDTTLAQHYHNGHRTNSGELILPKDDLIRQGNYAANTTPYDWRELSRALGSQSSGAYSEVLPIDLEAFLRKGDRQLRDGSNVSVVRVFGWHTDRLRLDKGTAEICNLGAAGGNVHKLLAVQEVVSKYIAALQQEYLAGADAHLWQAQYEHAVEVGQANNYFVGLSGKATKMIGENGKLAETLAVLVSVKSFIDTHSPEPLSDATYAELQATLAWPPGVEEFSSAGEVIKYFFEPKSNMTATEALRLAHQREPAKSVNDLLSLFSNVRREHLYDQEDALALRQLCAPHVAAVAFG